LVQHSISDEIEAIQENIHVTRAKFKPLLDSEVYMEDVSPLIDVVPQMLDNIEALAKELNHAFTILSNTPRND